MICKHCRDEISDGDKTIRITAKAKKHMHSAYVHQTCILSLRNPNAFTRVLIAKIGK